MPKLTDNKCCSTVAHECYLTRAEVAKAVNMRTERLQNWFDRLPEFSGMVGKARNGGNGHRRYSLTDAFLICIAARLSELGLPVRDSINFASVMSSSVMPYPGQCVCRAENSLFMICERGENWSCIEFSGLDRVGAKARREKLSAYLTIDTNLMLEGLMRALLSPSEIECFEARAGRATTGGSTSIRFLRRRR